MCSRVVVHCKSRGMVWRWREGRGFKGELEGYVSGLVQVVVWSNKSRALFGTRTCVTV